MIFRRGNQDTPSEAVVDKAPSSPVELDPAVEQNRMRQVIRERMSKPLSTRLGRSMDLPLRSNPTVAHPAPASLLQISQSTLPPVSKPQNISATTPIRGRTSQDMCPFVLLFFCGAAIC